MTGRINSIQSLGTVDGPGIRFVVFMQGCPLRCKCCHNPETWDFSGGIEYSAAEIVKKAARYKEYFGSDGGVTLSGGEPLLQARFAYEVFALCRENGINTCLDTSGCVMNESVKALLSKTDRVLLDLKYTTDEEYKENVGCSIETVKTFLSYLEKEKIPTTLRQVIIPTKNDTFENISRLNEIISVHKCIDKAELLPFRKLCAVKYENMGINFPFKDLPEAKNEEILKLESMLLKRGKTNEQ